MGDFINYLQHRIEEAKRELQEATDRVQRAQADKDMLGSELQGYERALTAEHRRQGIAPLKTGVQVNLSLSDSLLLSDSIMTETGVNKAAFTREFIRGRSETGATPTDILKGFQAAGIPISKPYIYSLVQRLQKQKAIRLKRDKWYPVPESEQSVNGAGEKVLP